MAKQRSIDIDYAFKFVFQDKEWFNKIGVAALLTLTVIGFLAVMGWALEIQRRVIQNKKVTPLPDWTPLGEYFVSGLKLWLVYFILSLPATLISCALSFPIMFSAMQNLDPQSSQQVFAPHGLVLAMQPLVYLLSIPALLAQPIASSFFAEDSSFKKAFRFRYGILLFRANWKQFLGVIFLSFTANYAASLVGFAALCIGLLFTTPIALAVMHNFYGQAYRNAVLIVGKEK